MPSVYGALSVAPCTTAAQIGGAFLGGGTRQAMTSEATARVIDEQVREIVDSAYERVMRLMRQHLDDMHQIVTVLMQRETLSGEEFSTLLGGGQLDPAGP